MMILSNKSLLCFDWCAIIIEHVKILYLGGIEMNKYEIMFIVKPDVEDDARNALIESFKGILTANGGTVDNVDEWGLRDLAYEIKDYKKGYYVVVDATCTAADVAEFERLSNINASMLRHLTLRK